MISRFLTQAKNNLVKTANLISLKKIKNIINKKHIAQIIVSNVLNTINSAIKILSPVTFGKAIEMVAKSETSTDDFGIEISTVNLFYLSTAFTAWTLVEGHIRKSLLLSTEKAFIKDLSLKLTEKSHEISIAGHLHLRNEIINGYFSIQNSCSQLPQEVINSFYPSVIDIVMGVAFIGGKVGREVGIGFLFYVLFDLFIYNNLIMACSHSRENLEKQNLRLGEYINHEYETLEHVETVRMSHREMFELATSRKRLIAYLNARGTVMRHDHLYNVLNKIPQLVATFMLVSRISVNMTINDIDESIFLLTYFSFFAASVDHCNYSLKMLFNIMNAIDKINEILNKKDEDDLQKSSLMVSQPIDDSKSASIEFCDVSFGYNKDNPVIRNLNLSIGPGRKVAVVGETGSGKSTLAQLLVQFYQPTSGAIKINGVDIKEMPVSTLRQQVGYVNQAPKLFSKESLHYNVAYGNPTQRLHCLKNSKKAKEASTEYQTFDSTPNRKADLVCKSLLEQVGLGSHIHRMNEPNGAMALSGGQKQQLVWARALAKKPRILICDEPTSALDSFTESRLLSNFFKTESRQTVLMIAHRLSTVKEMDEIVVLNKGQVVERGTHDELMELKGYYFGYWELQSREVKVAAPGC